MLEAQALDGFAQARDAIYNVLSSTQAAFDPYMAATFLPCRRRLDRGGGSLRATPPGAAVVRADAGTEVVIVEIERARGRSAFMAVAGSSPVRRCSAVVIINRLLGRTQTPRAPAPPFIGRKLTVPAVAELPSTQPYLSARVYVAEAQSTVRRGCCAASFSRASSAEPNLRVVLMELGVDWLPAFMWQGNKTWKGVRVEVLMDQPPPGRHHARSRGAHGAAVSIPRPTRPASSKIIGAGSARIACCCITSTIPH